MQAVKQILNNWRCLYLYKARRATNNRDYRLFMSKSRQFRRAIQSIDKEALNV